MGLGAYPGMTDPQFIGMLGMHGTYEANMAMHHCDVLFAIGARFDDRVTGKTKKVLPGRHASSIIDIDPASSISKNVPVDMPIVGSGRPACCATWSKSAASRAACKADAAVTTGCMVAADQRVASGAHCACATIVGSDLIKPQRHRDALQGHTMATLYLTSDVGQHQMFAAQFYPFDKPRRWINSGGLGTMGFGLPAAMGVQLRVPRRHRRLCDR
jgi:acetolactate synthase-1/2/3 large subunit